jgi:hypothetical protein
MRFDYQKMASKFVYSFLSNPNYLVLLAVFNVAILLAFQSMLWKNPVLFVVFFSSVLLSFLNYKFWWATILNVILSFYLLASNFPRQANHANVEFFIEIAILLIILFKIFVPKLKISGNLLSYLFRVFVVTFYFYTGFHKLNTAFFNPCVSCVNEVNEYILGNLIGERFTLSRGLSVFFQYATLCIEMILPFGLLWHRTRKYTAIVLVFFHFYLNFAVYADFSGLAGFLILGCVLDFESNEIKKPVVNALKFYLLFTLIALVIKLVLIKMNIKLYYINFIFGCIFNIGWFIFFCIFFKNYEEKMYPFQKKHLLLVTICIVATSCWTLKTYIGLGNAGNFTMFSNLMTEKSRSNHLIIDTKKTKLFNFEEDNVLILKLHDTLKKGKLENYRLPLIEFKYFSKKWCDRYPKIQINTTIVYKKDTLLIPDLRKTEFVITQWWYRYVFFRKIQPEGANECYW